VTGARTRFDPIEHGFRFPNYFVYQPNWPFDGPIWRRPFEFGLCGGMCYAALDYWHAQLPVPTSEVPPASGTALYRYLMNRQAASMLRPEVLPRLFTWIAKSDLAVGRLTARAFERLCAQLDAGLPTVLILVRTRRWESPTANHQVLATGYEFDEFSRRGTVYVYDPIYPCEEIDLYLDLSAPERGVGLYHQKGDLTRGFYPTGYAARTAGLPLEGIL
jgi:hypothetical protein